MSSQPRQWFGAARAVSLAPMCEADLDEVAQIEARNYEFPWTRSKFGDSLQAGHSAWVLRSGGRFVFTEPQRHCMWMKNTLLPLSVAFLDEEGRILNVEDMRPQTENNHCAAKPARFALEMNLGWFKQKGIGAGQKVEGAARLAAAAR